MAARSPTTTTRQLPEAEAQLAWESTTPVKSRETTPMAAGLRSPRSSDGSTFTNFDDPSGIGHTDGSGINNSGQIVGIYIVNNMEHGYLRSSDGSTFTNFDDPLGVLGTNASGINDSGQIVGVKPFLY